MSHHFRGYPHGRSYYHRRGWIVTHAAIVGVSALVATEGLPAQDRATTVGHALMLDGTSVGTAKVEGGGIRADVVETASMSPTGTMLIKKHIGAIHYDAIALDVGVNMGRGLYDWITASWAGTSPTKSGAIVTTDAYGKVLTQRTFTNALLTATTFPALDASVMDPLSIRLTITPSAIQTGSASGSVASKTSLQKTVLVSNFRLELDGLDATRVARIDSFTVRQQVTSSSSADGKSYAIQPGRIEFPNLRITIPESSAKSWSDWHYAFVIMGNQSDENERKGAIVLTAGTTAEEVLRIALHQCGIFALAPAPMKSGDGISRLTAELYCERMEFLPQKLGVARSSDAPALATEAP